MLVPVLLLLNHLSGWSPPMGAWMDDGPLYKPCTRQEDPSGIMGGPPIKSGTVDCQFLLEDPAHGTAMVLLNFEFRKSRYMPLDDDLDTVRKLEHLPETASGANHRTSLRLSGTFSSYRKPHFDDEAEMWLMPRWRDGAAQDASVPGIDWQPAPHATGVRCQADMSRCRVIARDDRGLFVVVFFEPKKSEPLETTATAIKGVVADW